MEEISVTGIDLAKSVFQLEALSPNGAMVWKKRLRRAAFTRFMEKQAPHCLVGFEACGGAHCWGAFSAIGFRVKMMAPKAVKAYREGPHKNDGRDAHAAAEAASRAQVRAVRVKSEAAQAVQALVRVRLLQIKQMVQPGNQLRGVLTAHGLETWLQRFCASRDPEKGQSRLDSGLLFGLQKSRVERASTISARDRPSPHKERDISGGLLTPHSLMRMALLLGRSQLFVVADATDQIADLGGEAFLLNRRFVSTRLRKQIVGNRDFPFGLIRRGE